jgi:hypothetical protein
VDGLRECEVEELDEGAVPSDLSVPEEYPSSLRLGVPIKPSVYDSGTEV